MTREQGAIPFDSLNLDGERVMLIGGAGFIGHHLALALRAKGAEVMVVDHMQINNIVKVVSDPDLEPARRQLYVNFLLDRFHLMREAGVHLENVDGRMLAEFTAVLTTSCPPRRCTWRRSRAR